MTVTLEALNAASKENFMRALGGVFESSPWVAEGAWERCPFSSLDDLHRAMVEVVQRAEEERQLRLIRAHPDLAGKAALAGELTESSQREQAGAGLDRLGPEEYARFHALNEAYKGKFGFPFIIAVKGHSKESILASFEERLSNDAAAERARALSEIAKIACFRLTALTGE